METKTGQDETPLRESKGLRAVLLSQFAVAFNDNASKLMLFGVAGATLATGEANSVVNALALLLVVPYLVFSPLAGWLADRFPKGVVIRLTLVLQVLGFGVVGVGAWHESMALGLAGFGVLAVQSALFSPAKRGILKELVGSARLVRVVGAAEVLVLGGIMLGSFAGGLAFDFTYGALGGEAWKSASILAFGLSLVSAASWLLFSRAVSPPAAAPEKRLTAGVFFGQLRDLRYLRQERGIGLGALGAALVWVLGTLVVVLVMQYSNTMSLSGGAATASGLAMVWLGAGLALGSYLGTRMKHPGGGIDLGHLPIALGGLSVSLVLLAFEMASGGALDWVMALLGLFSGWFLIPLMAWIQDRAKAESRGRVMAAENFLTNLGVLLGLGVQWGVTRHLGWTLSDQAFCLGLLLAVAGVWAAWQLRIALFRRIVRWVVSIFYRVNVTGAPEVPREGGVLFVANHVSYVDALLMACVLPREVRFLSHARFQKTPVLGGLLRLANVIPVSSERATDAIRSATQALEAGEAVAIFPEGCLTRDGGLGEFKRGFELIARKAGVPVVPVCLDGLWGSIFSFRGGRFFWKRPKSIPYPVRVHVGRAIPATSLTMEETRSTILDLGESAWQARPELKLHLGEFILRSLAKEPGKEILVDRTHGKKPIKAATLMALAGALAAKIKREIPEERVGILLPPGLGATISNLAVVLAGKSPVNLNFSLGPQAMQSCLDSSGIRTTLTAAQVIEKIGEKNPGLPWSENRWDVREVLLELPKAKVIMRILAGYLLPGRLLSRLWGVPDSGDNAEAGLLFTSGSDGAPKGVVLSHRNILANCLQIESSGVLVKDLSLLGNLPIFHSFGFTVSIWCALYMRVRTVTLPSPLEFARAAKVIAEEKVGILLGTPTFLRPYLKRVETEKMESLRIVVAGAEKTPDGFREAWEARFPGSRYLEGYGLTETTPVTSVNVPDFVGESQAGGAASGSRSGSVGRLFPGMAAKILDPDTGEALPLSQVGILCLKGPNVFSGYLDAPEKTKAVFQDGWYVTGDLARFDAENFLFIEGRLSRFSKIGGEMVPHGTVETTIAKALGVADAEVPVVAVSARQDAQKGEALVLLTTQPITLAELREKLEGSGLSNLWIPKDIQQVDAIPTLPTGKLDLKGLRRIASGNGQ